MATEPHNVVDNIQVTLDADIAAGDTSFDVTAGGGATLPSVPFWVRVNLKSEQMEITDVSTDTLTAVRGANGTAATSHHAGDKLDVDIVAALVTESNNQNALIFAVLSRMTGGGDGVFRDQQEPTNFEVIAQAAPDMTVRIRPGEGMVSGLPVRTTANTDSATLVAPVGNPRIDVVQISRYDVISVKGGSEAGSPSAPAVDADNLLLAEIFHRVGETSIKDTDDATNGFITDAREYV